MKKIVLIFFILFITIFYYINSAKKEYLIGSSLPLKGIMKEMGNSVKLGTKMSYSSYKRDLKKDIKYLFLDDKYEPKLTIENINKLYKKNVFLFYGIVGTPTVKKVLPFLNKHSIFLYAPFSGADFLRKNSNVINFRASYKDEINNIIKYLKNKNISKIGVFYQNDEYGKEIYFFTYKTLSKSNLSLRGVGTYKRNTFFIKPAINEISKYKPQAIIIAGTSEVSAMFIKKYRKIDKNVKFITISFVDPDNLIKYIKNKKNIIFSEVVPYYYDDIQEAKMFIRTLKSIYPQKKPTFFAFEAYLANKILLRAFNKLSFPYTPSHLVKIIKKTPKNFLKGIEIECKNNQLLNKTYLFKYENKRFKEIK